MRRQVFRALVVAFLALPMVGGAGSAASAASGVDLLCPGSMRLDFGPGLNLSSRPQQISGKAYAGTAVSQLTPCSSPLNGTRYTGGTGVVTGTGTVGCLSIGLLAGSAQGTVAFTWDNGDTSAFTWKAILGAPIPIVTGSVVGGELTGTNFILLGVAPTGLTGNCVGAPLTGLSVSGAVLYIRP